MRLLLALLIIFPALAQEAAKPEAKPEEKKAEAASPAPSAEEWLTGNIDFGYRAMTDLRGSRDVYRSIVNLGEGPRLFGADLTLADPKHRFFDRIDIRLTNWGGDPYNTAHLDARKQGVYDLRVDYRNVAYFNSLPSFANTGLGTGNLLSEHRFDTYRRMSNVELELMPGKRIVPYFAFSRDTGRGQSVATFFTDANDYSVPGTSSDHTNNIRGGVRFEFNRWHVTLEQGGTTYSNDQSVLETQTNPGDRPVPLFGKPLSITNANQIYDITADSIYTKVLGTANPFSWMNVYGQFLFSQPKTDVKYNDSVAGNLLLNSLLAYPGQTDLASGTAKSPHSSANVGFEVRFCCIRIVESLSTDHMHNASFGILTETLLLGANKTNPLPPAALNDRLQLNYNREQVDVFFDVTKKLTIRGGYRYVWGDATNRAGQLNQLGSLESSEMKQQVGLGGLSYHATQKLSFNMDYEGASGDKSYFRTSLRDYQKGKARVRYQVASTLNLQATYAALSNENPTPGIKYDFMSRDFSLSAFWTPAAWKRITVMGDYTRSTVRSDINYLVPSQLSVSERSFYRDNAHTATSLVDLALPQYASLTPKLSFGGSLFVSAGSRPSRYYQPLLRLSLPLQKHVYWNTEWRWYGYGEQFYAYEGFRTHVFATGMRLVR